MNNNTESEIIARLILSTKRKKRKYSIVEIANDIYLLKELKGGLGKVADIVGISTDMLKQFLSISNLPEEVIALVDERKIDSVAIVFLLSKFPKEDCLQLAKIASEGKLTSSELKILLPYRKQHSSKSIIEILEEVRSSKNIRVSVIQFPKNVTKKTKMEISEIFKAIVGSNDFVDIVEDDRLFNIKIKKAGEMHIRKLAAEKKMSLSNLIITLVK